MELIRKFFQLSANTESLEIVIQGKSQLIICNEKSIKGNDKLIGAFSFLTLLGFDVLFFRTRKEMEIVMGVLLEIDVSGDYFILLLEN